MHHGEVTIPCGPLEGRSIEIPAPWVNLCPVLYEPAADRDVCVDSSPVKECYVGFIACVDV